MIFLLFVFGESIPVDGIIIEGNSEVNEAMLTGESMPVSKQPDDSLFAGTVNHHGILKVRATGIGQHTMIARIVHMVEQAQGSKAEIRALPIKFLQFLFLLFLLSVYSPLALHGGLQIHLQPV